MTRLLVCLAVVTLLPGCPLAPRDHEPMTLAAFKAQRPPEPVTLTARCELGTIYDDSWGGASKTHYCVYVRQPDASIRGYAFVDSQAGRDLYAILKDGREHRLVVTLHLVDRLGQPVDDRTVNACAITAARAP